MIEIRLTNSSLYSVSDKPRHLNACYGELCIFRWCETVKPEHFNFKVRLQCVNVGCSPMVHETAVPSITSTHYCLKCWQHERNRLNACWLLCYHCWDCCSAMERTMHSTSFRINQSMRGMPKRRWNPPILVWVSFNLRASVTPWSRNELAKPIRYPSTVLVAKWLRNAAVVRFGVAHFSLWVLSLCGLHTSSCWFKRLVQKVPRTAPMMHNKFIVSTSLFDANVLAMLHPSQ